MGDSGGALLAGIGCVVERLGVGAAIPSGYTASSASVAAPGWHHGQPSGKYHALVCRRAQRHAMDRAVTGAIRAAASNDLHGAQRHRVYLVGQGAAHVSVGASRQVGRTHGPDRTQDRDHEGRDVHHRSIRAHRGHCARARSPPLHGLPPSLVPPALFPRATGRVRSGLAALPPLGYPSSRATAGAGVECRAFLRRRLLVRAVAALVVGPSSSSCPIRRRAPVRPRPSRVLSWLSLRLPSPISLPSIPPCAAANRLLA